MKIISIATILLVTFLPADKDLKIILRDGQFSKIPTTAKIIGKEVIDGNVKRYGYLAFKTTTEDMVTWIKESNLILTSKPEMFDNNIIVGQNKRPTWFKDSFHRFVSAELYYYSKREMDSFIAVSWLDTSRKIIHLEYEIRP